MTASSIAAVIVGALLISLVISVSRYNRDNPEAGAD